MEIARLPRVKIEDITPTIMHYGAVWLMHDELVSRGHGLIQKTYSCHGDLKKLGLATVPFVPEPGEERKETYGEDDVSRIAFEAGRIFGAKRKNSSWYGIDPSHEGLEDIIQLRAMNAEFAEFILPIHRAIYRQINGGDLWRLSEFMVNSVQLYGSPGNPMSMHRHYDDTAHTLLLDDVVGLRVLINGVWYLLEPRPPGAALLITGNQSINALGHAVGPWSEAMTTRMNMASFYGNGHLRLLWSVIWNTLYKRASLRRVKGFS